ncbi:DUF2092 domain-containing protein [Sinorhizobium psoraleae]|uniref:DUF2092 domain-containing protein n=1 Tax=Sinorhizobium psoraleae TaxID=520838 RepID=A0ABT4KE33_9HYPH|nr:DUF2092 domain-containing protein [Sinorhizobium psoraleae]MCZ4090218.1 DUF2092 domain-containing protein [Sinorhizobium psoraleae]
MGGERSQKETSPLGEQMNRRMMRWPRAAWRSCTLISMLAASAVAWPVSARDGIDPEADRILAAASENLKSMRTLSVDYDADQEILTLDGQKIQYSASGSIALDRAKGFRMKRMGPFARAEVIFDGNTISLHDRITNAYAQLQSPGRSVEDATEELRATTELDAPGADLLASDPYAVLTDGVTEGTLVGSAFVNGVECDHLAFRTDVVDWQIWISKGSKPLPLKYVITTKWMTGAPQYTLRLSNWNSDAIEAAQFTFTPPADANKVEHVHADVTGELSMEAGQ